MASVLDERQLTNLIRDLRVLPERVQKNVLRGMTRAGANTLKKEIKAKVPVNTGALKKAITVTAIRGNRNNVGATVGVKKIELDNGKSTKNTRQYMYYLEFGTKSIRAKPIFRQTYEQSGTKVVEGARAYFPSRFEKEKRKLGLR